MTKRFFSAFWLLLLAVALLFMACDDFYSKSWGQERDYDLSNITVDAGNVDSWVDTATGNPKLAEELTQKVTEQLKTATGTEKAKLEEAGVKLALTASGVGTSMISNAGTILARVDEKDADGNSKAKDDLKVAMQNIRNTPSAMVGINNGAANLVNIITPTTDSTPHVPVGYDPSPADVSEVVMVLTMNLMKEDKQLDNVRSIHDSLNVTDDPDPNKRKVRVDANAPREAVLLAAYLNLIVENDKYNDNDITKAIKQGFVY